VTFIFHLFVEYPVLIGVAAALIFVGIRMTLVPSDRRRCDWFLAASALALPANMLSENAALRLSHLKPFKLDEYIFQIDGLLGFQPSFAIGRFLARHIWFKITCSMAYSVLPCVVLVVFGFYLWQRSESETLTVLRSFLLNLFGAVPIYLLAPACGPAFAFTGFPFTLPEHLIPHPIALSAPPNCIPSVHMSTALLILWFSRRWPAGIVLSTVYMALIVVATLGSGQHYLFDLFVALPYTAVILWIGTIAWKRSSQKEHISFDLMANGTSHGRAA
jgi:hypothetical protein